MPWTASPRPRLRPPHRRGFGLIVTPVRPTSVTPWTGAQWHPDPKTGGTQGERMWGERMRGERTQAPGRAPAAPGSPAVTPWKGHWVTMRGWRGVGSCGRMFLPPDLFYERPSLPPARRGPSSASGKTHTCAGSLLWPLGSLTRVVASWFLLYKPLPPLPAWPARTRPRPCTAWTLGAGARGHSRASRAGGGRPEASASGPGGSGVGARRRTRSAQSPEPLPRSEPPSAPQPQVTRASRTGQMSADVRGVGTAATVTHPPVGEQLESRASG